MDRFLAHAYHHRITFFKEAVGCYDRTLQLLAEEYAFTEGEPVRQMMVEKQRLLELMRK